MNLTFRHFEIVHLVAQCRGISRAAGLLGLTQSAVTHALHALEDQIGAPLFARSPQGLEPTEAAQIFLHHHKKIQLKLDGIFNEIERIKRLETGKLTIATGLWPSALSVELAVARLSTLYPNMVMEIIQEPWRVATERIARGEIDIGVIELENALERFDMAHELLNSGQAYFYVRADHPLTQRSDLGLADIAAYPLVGNPWKKQTAETLQAFGGGFGVRDPDTGIMRPTVNARSFWSMRNIVLHSDCVGMCLKEIIADDISAGRVKLLDYPALMIVQAHYGFVWPKYQTLSPAILSFMDMVRTIEREKRTTVDN